MDVRRDLVTVALGASLGALITIAINAIVDESPDYVVLGAAIIVLSWLTLVSVRQLGPIRAVLSSSGGVRIDGEWSGNFGYEKLGSPVSVQEKLEIRQRGRYVTGTSVSTSISGDFPADHTTYAFNAVLTREALLNGTWRSTVRGSRYEGSFQAVVRRGGRTIAGTWIGVDDTAFQRGEFEWIRD